jgi:hypothetical protein
MQVLTGGGDKYERRIKGRLAHKSRGLPRSLLWMVASRFCDCATSPRGYAYGYVFGDR